MVFTSSSDAAAPAKRALRRELLINRSAPLPSINRKIVSTLADIVFQTGLPKVACVWPLPGEVDLRPLCRVLERMGRAVYLPETPPKGSALQFRHWTSRTRMREGRFGTVFPAGPFGQPELILVPLVAFDRQGGRLGYGGGYYDRTLAAYPQALAIGYGQAAQEVPEVPCGPYDRALSCIVTEQEVLRFPAAAGAV